MAGRRFEDVAVSIAVRPAELQRSGRLHRAAPHVDRIVEQAGDDRHGMEPVPERLESRPSERDPGDAPAEEDALALGRRAIAEWDRTAGQDEVDGPRLEQAEDESKLADLGRVRGASQRLGGQAGVPDRAAADERLGELGERREVGVGPAGGGGRGSRLGRAAAADHPRRFGTARSQP